MKFKVLEVKNVEDYKSYKCLFSNDEIESEFVTTIGFPEINDINKVLNILSASCKASFGFDSGIYSEHKCFSGDFTEMPEDWIQCV